QPSEIVGPGNRHVAQEWACELDIGSARPCAQTMSMIEIGAEALENLIVGTGRTRYRRSGDPCLAEGLQKPADRRRVAAAQAATPVFILEKAMAELVADIAAIETVP